MWTSLAKSSEHKEPDRAHSDLQLNSSLKQPTDSTNSQRIAWSTSGDNQISVFDLETKQCCSNFDGVQLKIPQVDPGTCWNHVREIPNTNLLASLNNCWIKAGNMEIFSISQSGAATKVYSFEELKGFNGLGDMTYNSRRSLLAALCLSEKIAYHLFNINCNPSKLEDAAKLIRKSRWHPKYSKRWGNFVTSFDFEPNGELIGTIDQYGACLLSDVTTNEDRAHVKMEIENFSDEYSRCRWSTNSGDPYLYFKYDRNLRNILDSEKKTLVFKESIEIEEDSTTYWLDVCPCDGNLLASCGRDGDIKIFDRRESKIVKTFPKLHDGRVFCVRWNPTGEKLVSASGDGTIQVVDFNAQKAIQTTTTLHDEGASSVCFMG